MTRVPRHHLRLRAQLAASCYRWPFETQGVNIVGWDTVHICRTASSSTSIPAGVARTIRSARQVASWALYEAAVYRLMCDQVVDIIGHAHKDKIVSRLKSDKALIVSANNASTSGSSIRSNSSTMSISFLDSLPECIEHVVEVKLLNSSLVGSPPRTDTPISAAL